MTSSSSPQLTRSSVNSAPAGHENPAGSSGPGVGGDGKYLLGEPVTAEITIRKWRPLAAEMAAKYADQYCRQDMREDLEQEGMIAIAAAHESYDSSRGCSWAGWVTHRIRWAMLRYLEHELHLRRRGGPIVMVGLDQAQAHWWNDEDRIEDIENLIDVQIRTAEVHQAAERLSERQQKIVQMTFQGDEGMTVRDIGAALEVSIGTVSQELGSAIRILRSQLKAA